MNPEEAQIVMKFKDILTKKDALVILEKMKDYALDSRKMTEKELATIKEAVDKAIERIHNTASTDAQSIKDEVSSKLENEMNKIMLQHEAMMSVVDAKLAEVQDGLDGVDADEERVIAEVLARLPAQKMTPFEIRDALESIELEDEQLNIEAIRGLKEILEKLKKNTGTHSTIIGGNHPLSTLPDVNAQGITNGQVLVWNSTLGRWEAGTPSTSGMTILSATETPNGTTTVFTYPSATAKPSFIVSDNVWLRDVSKAGTVNWTWSGTQATLTIPSIDENYAIV